MAHLKLKQHLFFDLDDTLWDFERNSAIVIQELFDEFQLAQKLNIGFEVFIETYKKINLSLWSKYYKKQIDKQYLRNHRFNEAFKLFAYDNYEENLLITEQYLLRSPKGNFLKADCIEILDYLRNKYQLHIITNGFKEVQFIKLEGSGLKKYFQNIIISEEHDLNKPDTKIFRLAEKLSATQKEHCVMIGDNFESDIEGGMNAGWDTVYFSENKADGYTGHQIKALIELKALF